MIYTEQYTTQLGTVGTRPKAEIMPIFLYYDKDTGVLLWRRRTAAMCSPSPRHSSEVMAQIFNKRWAGKVALSGLTRKGYMRGVMLGCSVLYHRAAWTIATGSWPKGLIDHIDQNPKNNRLSNLRDVSCAENSRNQRLRSVNKTGVMGVYKTPHGTFTAHIGNAASRKHLGTFPSIEQAIDARKLAELENGYHPNHGRAS